MCCLYITAAYCGGSASRVFLVYNLTVTLTVFIRMLPLITYFSSDARISVSEIIHDKKQQNCSMQYLDGLYMRYHRR